MDVSSNGDLHDSDRSSPDGEHMVDEKPSTTGPMKLMSSPRRSSAPSLQPLCPASLLLQAAAGLEAMTTYRAAVAAAVGGGSTSTTTPPVAQPTTTVASPPTTPRSDLHHQQQQAVPSQALPLPPQQQQQHRGPQPISPPPPSPQISAAELSLLTEASATTNGTFQCTLCSKQFGYKNGLIRHVRLTHVGEKPYQCTICNRRFGYKHILMEHQNLHFGNRPYACALCDKRFAARSNLIQHRMVHRRPYNCTMCSKRFDREDQLKKHLFAHPQSHLPPGGGAVAPPSSTTVAVERPGRRRSTAAGASVHLPDETSGMSPPLQVRGGISSSSMVFAYGAEDDGSGGRPGDDDDSLGSRGSSSPEPEEYGKPLAGLASVSSLISSTKLPPPTMSSASSLTGNRIDAICSQLSSSVSSSSNGSGQHHHHHQRQSHHQQQQQQQQMLGGLFPGVVIKKEKLDEGVMEQYGGMPMELSGRRQSSPRGVRPNGVEMEVDRTTTHHAVQSAALSTQYPLTSFAAWTSSVPRHSSGSGPLPSFSAAGTDHPLTVAVGSHNQSACSSSSSALPGIHEVFSRRPSAGNSSSGSTQKLPSFANFMPLSVPTAQTGAGHQSAPGGASSGSAGCHPTTYKGPPLPDLGLSLLHSPPATSTNNHQLVNGVGGGLQQHQQQQQQQSGVVNPTPRPTAQLPPISLQPMTTTSAATTTPSRHTKDQGVQHSQSMAGFPSLEDVLSYYVSQGRLFRCQHCSILFFERGMYFLHASLHGLTSPWECSICHRVCSDKNEFTLHFVNQQHNC